MEPTAPPPTEMPATEIPATEAPQTETPVDDDPPATAEPTAAPEEEAVEETVNTGQGPLVFQIVPGESEMRFEINETLRGSPNTVVGITDQVAGELAVDLADLSNSQVGTIQINARTLATNNEFRNRAIKNEILDTNDYELITFSPTAIDGLPESAAVGEMVEFMITGDLTIRDFTNEETFTIQATIVSPSELTGQASTVVERGDYGLQCGRRRRRG